VRLLKLFLGRALGPPVEAPTATMAGVVASVSWSSLDDDAGAFLQAVGKWGFCDCAAARIFEIRSSRI
jgi:hypothetical protein